MADDSAGRQLDREAYFKIWGVMPEEGNSSNPRPSLERADPEIQGAPITDGSELHRLKEAVLGLRRSVELLAMKTEAQTASIERALNDLSKRIEDMARPDEPFKAYGQD